MDPRKSSSANFVDVATQFIETLADTWPNDFSDLRTKLRTRARNLESDTDLLLKFDETFKHLFEKSTHKDPSVFEDPFFDSYKAKQKFDESNQDTINVIWQYIEHLVRFTTMHKMYDGIPQGVMSVISNSILDVKTKLDDGSLDTKYLNPLELGQDVLAKLSPDDIQQMTNNLLGNEKSMLNMLNTMQILMQGMNQNNNTTNIMSMLQNPENLMQNMDISKLLGGLGGGLNGLGGGLGPSGASGSTS